jgi:hypothetical protein
MLTLAEWLARRPSDRETAREEIEPFLDMTPDERLKCFEGLQRAMDVFVRMHRPVDDPANRDFWRHWRDPGYGRPR